MYPIKVLRKNSKAELESSPSFEGFTSNKSLGLGNLFLDKALNENFRIFDSNDESKISTDSRPTSPASIDDSTDSDFADSENSDDSKSESSSDDEIKSEILILKNMRDHKVELEIKSIGKNSSKESKNLNKNKNTKLNQFIRQLREDDTDSVASKDTYISDLRSILSLSSTDETQKSKMKFLNNECSVFEILDMDDCWSAWNYNNQSNKIPLSLAIDQHLNDHPVNNVVRVDFGKFHFNCHRMVLRFAKFFQNRIQKTYKFETNQKITPIAFMHFYRFAMDSEPIIIAAKYFLDVLKAAEILNVPELQLHCLGLLDSQLYHEFAAFEIYKAAKEQENLRMQRLMLQRIWKHFLPFVATKYFVDLNVDDVCRFLNADTIGVNSEIEIFYAAVLWLNTKWKKRKGKILERVMRCVRYGLLPPWFAYTLKNGTGIVEVDRILESKYVAKMIEDGASIAATIGLYFMEPPKFEAILQRLLPKVPKQRKWIFDKNCTYHYGAHEKVSEAVDYIVFKDYLKMLQLEGQNYWHYIEEAKDDHLVKIFSQKFSDTAWSKLKF